MTKCYYIATRMKEPGSLYRLRFTIKSEDAINSLDAGIIEIIGVSKERCQWEHDAMQALGYEMVSELRNFLGLPQKSG